MMTSNVFYKGKEYACEFVKNVQVTGEINGQFKIYIDRIARRAFLVDEFNKGIVAVALPSFVIDALLDNEDKDHEYEVNCLCDDFAHLIYEMLDNTVEIKLMED